jgi:hypothetical protein
MKNGSISFNWTGQSSFPNLEKAGNVSSGNEKTKKSKLTPRFFCIFVIGNSKVGIFS